MRKSLRLIPLFVFVLSASSCSSADQPSACAHDSHTFRCVKFVKNYDGDTVTVEIPEVHPLFGKHIPVRVLGIDTPEKTGHKPCEKERARDAQRLVEHLMKDAKQIELRNIERDKYFRILAEVWVDGRSIAELLLKNNLAYAYDGGTKPKEMSWCRTTTKGRALSQIPEKQ